MKAMVLAAGLGTRLRPLTNDRPKALVEVAERTLLEITLRRLQSFGVNEVIVNTHHFVFSRGTGRAVPRAQRRCAERD
jgi:NDP-sugar pyrophosphorylase family protein